MPTYEYECSACQHQLEIFQDMSDPVLTKCPACQQTSLQKLISATNFQLKGTGWYVTDFRNKNNKNTDSTPSKTETTSSSTTTTTDTTTN